MKTTYKNQDVTVLLSDITGKISPLSSKEREILIQNGKHYSELLPTEYAPTEEYLSLYKSSLIQNAKFCARALAVLAKKIVDKHGDNITIVSLARAGTPIGILLKRFLQYKYEIQSMHYTISIIRDRGIDHNAMKYILDRHDAKSIVFVDGWIGKGAISKELDKIGYEGVSTELAVLSDPASITSLYGTRDDFLIPSSILNAPVSGCFSRTVLNELITDDMFHGSVFYADMNDLSYDFIENVEKYFTKDEITIAEAPKASTGYDEVLKIAKEFDILDINLIKPTIGETTRVLMRRTPDIVLIQEESEHLKHILALCAEKNVKVIKYPLENYRAVGIIKNLKDI